MISGHFELFDRKHSNQRLTIKKEKEEMKKPIGEVSKKYKIVYVRKRKDTNDKK